MPLTFNKWKKRFYKDMVCTTPNEVQLWLKYHGIDKVPTLIAQYPLWLCKCHSKQKVTLSHERLILKIRGFQTPYKSIMSSLKPVRALIKNKFFDIFGNTCKIEDIDKRIIEKNPTSLLCIQVTDITAYVKPQYREERSGSKISKFYINAKRRRNSCPHAIEHLRPTKSHRSKSLQLTIDTSPTLTLRDLSNNYHWSTDTYHNRLIEYFTEGVDKNNEHPRMVLMFGVPGSGKNWVLEKRRKKNHVNINVDDCLAMLPPFWRGMLELQERDKRAHDWIQMFRAECQVIAKKLFKFAIDNKMNIVWNGTGKNMEKYTKFIDLAKKRGYIVELNGIWVPLNVAKKRITQRRKSYGRPVPDSVFALAASNIPQCFKTLRHRADYARIWENCACESPKVLWDKQQGWIDDQYEKNKKLKWVPDFL